MNGRPRSDSKAPSWTEYNLGPAGVDARKFLMDLNNLNIAFHNLVPYHYVYANCLRYLGCVRELLQINGVNSEVRDNRNLQHLVSKIPSEFLVRCEPGGGSENDHLVNQLRAYSNTLRCFRRRS